MKKAHALELVGIGLALLVAQADALANTVKSNYEHFSKLDLDQETSIGVITPPDSAELVSTHKGIKILDVEDRRYSKDEIEHIKRLIDLVPERMLASPPKAIIAASKSTAGRIYRPNMVASASGPYIFLGDKFFIGGFRSKHSSNDRLQIFMHEYAHVIQYYHLDIETGKQSNMDDQSSIVFDFATKVGWQVKKGFGSKKEVLQGDKIQFNSKEHQSWFLPEDKESETSRYGRTSNVEDQAESFGWVIAGHPSLISESRANYVLSHLAEPVENFTRGKIPLHKDLKKARSKGRGLNRFFNENALTDPQETLYYFVEKEQSMTFDELLMFFSKEFKSRGFSEVKAMESKVLPKNKEDYAHAIYEYQGEKVQIQIIDFTNAINYSSKGNMSIEIARE